MNVDDEILAIDGFRVKNNLEQFIAEKKVGESVEILISRDNIIQTLTIPLKENGAIRYHIAPENTSKNKVFSKWMMQ